MDGNVSQFTGTTIHKRVNKSAECPRQALQESDPRHLSPPVATSVGPCGGSEIGPAQELGIGAWVPT